MNRRNFLAAGALLLSVLPEWWPPWDDPGERDLDDASLEELREELSDVRDRLDEAETEIDENRTGIDGIAATVAEQGEDLDAIETRLVDVEAVANLVAVEDLADADGQAMVIEGGVVLSAAPDDTEADMLGTAEYTAQWDGDNDELVFFVRDGNNDLRQTALATEDDDGGLIG